MERVENDHQSSTNLRKICSCGVIIVVLLAVCDAEPAPPPKKDAGGADIRAVGATAALCRDWHPTNHLSDTAS